MIFGLLLLFFLDLINLSELLHGLFAVIAEGDFNFKRVLIFVGYFEQGMERMSGFFTFGAKVVVLANETFVDDSFDWEGKTPIALNILIQYLIGFLNLFFHFTIETKLLSLDCRFILILKLYKRVLFFLFLERHISDASIHDLNLRDLACNRLYLHISLTFFDDKLEIAELGLSYRCQHFFSQSQVLLLSQVNLKLQRQLSKALPDNLLQLIQRANFLHIDIFSLSLVLDLQSLTVHPITINS